MIARKLRRAWPRPDVRWHLDEVFVSINGRQWYVWRAVDSEGEVLDILVQPRRDRKAALKLMRKLLKKQGGESRVLDLEEIQLLPKHGAASGEIQKDRD